MQLYLEYAQFRIRKDALIRSYDEELSDEGYAANEEEVALLVRVAQHLQENLPKLFESRWETDIKQRVCQSEMMLETTKVSGLSVAQSKAAVSLVRLP